VAALPLEVEEGYFWDSEAIDVIRHMGSTNAPEPISQSHSRKNSSSSSSRSIAESTNFQRRFTERTDVKAQEHEIEVSCLPSLTAFTVIYVSLGLDEMRLD
jgi:hypothetical protein